MVHSSGGQYRESPEVLPNNRLFTPHIIVLSVCLFILLAAFLLSPSRSVDEPLYIGSLPLPHACTFKSLTGLPCPGCGLSRSLVAAVHGDVTQSLHFHRLGLLTLVYIFFQAVYRIGAITVPSLTVHIRGLEKHLNRFLIFLSALFFLNWIHLLVF